MQDEAEAPFVIGQPVRLTNEQHFSRRASLRIYHQFVHQPAAVHWHEFYEMYLILAGEGTHVLNGTVYPLARGSFVLLTPADFHAVDSRPGAPLELFNVIFSDGALSDEVRRLLFGDLVRYTTTFADAALVGMEAEFRRLWSEAQEQPLGYRLVMQGVLERILIDVVRHTGARESHGGSRQANPRRKIEQVRIYIHHHFREPLTLAQAAYQADLSPHYFSECFHAATGVPFQRYLRDLRLRFAHSLMVVSDASITDLCLASGFSSLSNFERAFKAHYGLSPRAYRAAPEEPPSA